MDLKFVLLLAVITALYSCNANTPTALKYTVDSSITKSQKTTMTGIRDTAFKERQSRILVANETDPVCDMPTRRGSEDTTLYKGKIIGFCSKECKDEFIKKPKAYKIKYK